MNDLAELEHHQQLTAWAEGVHSIEAATKLLIRGGWAQTWRPWVKRFDGQAPGHWIDFEAIPNQIDGLSGGERRFLLIAASLGAGVPVDLSDALSTLDRGSVSLVLAAIAHTAGTHTGTQLIPGAEDGPTFIQPGTLYAWPGESE
jgi:hypothetical protein